MIKTDPGSKGTDLTRSVQIDWTDLMVTDAEGASGGTLGNLVMSAPANLDSAVLNAEGRIIAWPDFFISAEGEEADWNTPHAAVNWTGLRKQLNRDEEGLNLGK